MNIFKRFWLAINQSTCLIVTGQNDFTISGWSYIQKIEHGNPFYANVIDKLFFWQTSHCAKALIWEVNAAHDIARNYTALREIAREERDSLIKH